MAYYESSQIQLLLSLIIITAEETRSRETNVDNVKIIPAEMGQSELR